MRPMRRVGQGEDRSARQTVNELNGDGCPIVQAVWGPSAKNEGVPEFFSGTPYAVLTWLL